MFIWYTLLTEAGSIHELNETWHMAQVGALLKSQNLEARIWGAQAFGAYVHTQVLSHALLTSLPDQTQCRLWCIAEGLHLAHLKS